MKKTLLNEEALWEDMKKVSVNEERFESNTNSPPQLKRIDAIERRIVGLVFWKREKRNNIGEENVLVGVLDEIEIEKRANDVLKERFKILEKDLEKDKELLLFETESYYNKANAKKDIEELLLSLEEEYLKKDLSVAMQNLQKAEQKRESSEILKHLEECQRITQRINAIKTIKNAYEKK